MRAVSRRRWIDGLAVVVLLAYGWLAWSVQSGTPAIDPVYASIRERGVLRVAVDAGYRPFVEERNSELVGFDIDLVQALANEMGVEVTFVRSGFDALYDQLTSRQADLIASALPYAPEQGYRARFSRPYFDGGLMLVTTPESKITGLADLRERSIGIVLGSEGDALVRRFALTTPVARYAADEPGPLIEALQARAIDAVILDHVTALGVVATGDLRIATALSYEPYVLAMPAAAFQLEYEINRALTRLDEQGVLIELQRRWMMPDR
ncbi:MAG: amino acid ABC transporter substrate-binding protein [Chloroflexus sp.]|jgi:polar amino acid transport system substrate-binding protein|nr:amino acid ABC transporter substrate-binding protein [Chloroflexus sp.]MBO9338178.1 amino acid ABC transporter substrate-binding protein [Chloroflexus sp.]